MLITVHGFPPNTKYQDVKILIKQMSKIEDYMLGNLMIDKDGSKKVRIGLSDENEGYSLLKCLNGYRMGAKYILNASPDGKSAQNQPPQNNFDSRPSYSGNQQHNEYPNEARNFQGRGDFQNQPAGFGGRPQGPGGLSGPNGPPGPMNTGGRHGNWGQNNTNTGPWNSNPAVAGQGSQNNYNNYQPQQNVPPFAQQPGHSQRHDMRPFPQSRPQDPGFGYPPKGNLLNQNQGPPRPMDGRQLRNIETVETNNQAMHGRYQQPPQYQDKPVTIMKDNFQGPTQFNISHPEGAGQHYQEPGRPNWQQPGQQPKPFSKTTCNPYDKPVFEDRKYPPVDPREVAKKPTMRPDTYKEYEKTGRGISPSGASHAIRGSVLVRRDSAPGRRISPSGRRGSPSGRRISPSARRMSPPGRRFSPGRRISPPVRRGSPQSRGASPSARRISPSGRRISPAGPRVSPHTRRFSPSERRGSPTDRLPSGRGHSPNKRMSPRRSPHRDVHSRSALRYSPGRHHPEKSSDKFVDDPKELKEVRPAYEPSSQAQNQAMYSGGYRQSANESAQYPVPTRQVDPTRTPWQRDRDDYSKKEDDRRTARMDVSRERAPEKIVEIIRPPTRKSRSPVRRDRSPIKDRFKRHSPSPRSPRRSWALEKRRSPDICEAPPPPSWPGQNREEERSSPEYRHGRSKFSDRDQMDVPQHKRPSFSKSVPFKTEIPERSPYSKAEGPLFRSTFTESKESDGSKWDRPIDEECSRRPEIEEGRYHKASRDEPHGRQGDRYQSRESKFSPREDFDVERRGSDYRRSDDASNKIYSHRDDDGRRSRDGDRRHVEERRLRDESPRREIREKLLKSHTIDKDFEDIYNRALQFKKKAEELRRSANRRGDSEEGNNRSERDTGRSRFDDRRYEDEEPRSRNEERSRQDHSDYRRDSQRERNESGKIKVNFNVALRAKREKAIEEIASKIMERHKDFNTLQGEQRQRVVAELHLALGRIVFDMFGNQDVSFIEIIVKYQAKYKEKDEEKILEEVISSLPAQFRNIKRHAPEACDIPVKTSRHSSSPGLKSESPKPSKFSGPKISDWTILEPPKLVAPIPLLHMQQMQVMNPMMVPSPFVPSYDEMTQAQMYNPGVSEPLPDPSVDFNYSLYLCKDDFEPFTDAQAEYLKRFLVSQIFEVSQVSQGWAPDVTIKGLQGMLRYEIVSNDNMSRDWIINLDFSKFTLFNVLVYTKEELWYERAAVWLPGHSRSKALEPMAKLSLQNRHIEGINIDKWKFVKKIVNPKGTRLYIDMPPSSARALDKCKMMLSYELQKVNVFLRAKTVDKDAFDTGMRESSITDPAEITEAIQNCRIPSLPPSRNLVKISYAGLKSMSLPVARKIKQVLIYNIFKYHTDGGKKRTDFVTYGLVTPCYFGVVPENEESRKWLLSRQLGKINRNPIVVYSDADENTNYIQMYTTIPYDFQATNMKVIERLKQSNQGVKGLKFNIWKPISLTKVKDKFTFDVHIDMESLATMSTMGYKLDYSSVHQARGPISIGFKAQKYSNSDLNDVVRKYKEESHDTYDAVQMDLDSNESEEEVVCLN